MRLSVLTPTVVALLAVVPCARLSAADATTGARDAQFEAVRQLIDHELQSPAARQLKLFQAANYPEADWYQKFLSWDYSDRFHDLEPEQVEAAAKEIAEASKAGRLPPVVQAAFKGGGGTMWRMVQELAQKIGPDVTPDSVGAANLNASEKDRRNRLVKGIVAACDVEWTDALNAVAANKAAEDKLQDMDDKNPAFSGETYKACNLRYEAVHVLQKAHIVLREVITRGPEFGIDPQPAIDYFTKVLSYQKDGPSDLGKWDYDWGLDYMPLKADVNEMLGESLRLKLKDASADDVETSYFQVFDYNLQQLKPNVRDQFIELQLQTWASMLRWHLEMGDDASLKRAVDDFNNLLERQKGAGAVSLNGDDRKCQYLAQCYLVMARIQNKLHNTAASSSLLGKVASARQNPESYAAGRWLLYFSQGDKSQGAVGGDEWAQAPEADDPSASVDTARAFLAEAQESDDPKQQHRLYTHAAVALRNGILGLSDGYEDQFIAQAPIIYERYAFALYKLDMHYHAAIAAEEGMRAIAARITPKESPWRVGKNPKGVLTEEGKPLEKLCKNAATYASLLRQRAAKSQMVEAVHGTVLDLAFKILPESLTADKEWSKAYDDYQSNDYDRCMEDVRALIKANPGNAGYYYKGFSLITSCLMGQYEKAKASGDQDAMQRAGDELTKDSNKIIGLLGHRPKESLTSDEAKALTTAISTPVFISFNAKKYDDVINTLNAEFWKSAPQDEDLRARMLSYMTMSALAQQKARVDEQGKGEDAKTILAEYPRQLGIYEIYKHQAQKLKSEAATSRVEGGGKAMAATFNSVQRAATFLIMNGDAAAEKLKPLIQESRKALADLMYGTLGIRSKPDNLLAVAGLLWDMPDHERSAVLYRFYLRQIAKDARAQDFKHNPKPVLDQVEGVVGQRPELRNDWKLIRDLCEDGPAVDDWRDGKIDRSQLTEEPIDYARATEKLRAFIASIDQMRALLGEASWKQMHELLDPLLAMVTSLAQEIQAMKRVAQYDRESGNGSEARAFYDTLNRYNPDDPDTAVAQVENVLEDIKKGDPVAKDQIDHARHIAAKIRADEGDNNPRMFWTSQIQVFELSIALNDMANVNDALKAINNHGDVSNDLVSPPVHGDAKIRGDDKRVRRPANPEAVILAQRYLKLFKAQGVTVQPSFELRDIDVDGKTFTVFVDAGAPKMVGHGVENADGDQVVEFLPEGVDPLADAKPAPAPTGGSATAGQVANPAPAAPQGAHP